LTAGVPGPVPRADGPIALEIVMRKKGEEKAGLPAREKFKKKNAEG